jgi:hypothetical protein
MANSTGSRILGLLALCLCSAACGDDADHVDAAVESDQPSLRMLVREEIEYYDRRVRAICPCLVESGTYETEQECLDYSLSGPDWVECATRALADFDNPNERAEGQCFADYTREAAECTEAAECDPDKLVTCGVPDPECLAAQSERINALLEMCPDFGLLSRVSP